MNTNDTICAIATAPGGAIGLIRISGPRAITCLTPLFRPAGNKPLNKRPDHSLTFGQLTDPSTGEMIDEVLVSLFHAGHSYTGEESVEISCHGSSYILNRVISLLISEGCRSARPGEFTQRAFLNGRMDLSQAEAVADLIASQSAASHRIAMSQMRGDFSKALARLREQLLHITSLMELELDFSEEDVEFADRQQLITLTEEIITAISRLVKSFHTGNSIKKGVPVAIIGPTNAGKSTLLNALLHEERAIVSDIHGTTRDTIEDCITLGGILFRFIDTAGIRETTDTIENLGIERSFRMADQADIVLLVTDCCGNTLSSEQMAEIIRRCSGKSLIHLINKMDLNTPTAHDTASSPTSSSTYTGTIAQTLYISAKEQQGIEELEQLLTDIISQQLSQEELLITNARHFEALTHALDAILRVKTGMEEGLPGDLISQDLRECIFHLAEIVGGQITSDEVLHTVFREFCIGK